MYKIDEIKMLRLGQRDENLARPLTFDCSDWLEQYPEASIHILFRRPGESAIVPMSTTLEGTTLTWLIHDFEVGKTGVGNAEFRAVDTAGLRRKSRIIPCSIEETLLGDDETVLYTQDQVDETLAHISEAAQAAQAAKASEEAAALSASEAGESAASAGTAADVAVGARDAAQAAQTAAETAQHQAEAAQSGVHADAEAAKQAKVAAQAAQASAQGAASQASADRTAAESARADAEAAATHAEAVVEGIDQAGADQVAAVTAAGQAQVSAVNQAGTTQVGNVNAAGTTQVNAVQAKGAQVLDSIPADYSALTEDVTSLKSALTSIESSMDLKVIPQMIDGRYVSNTGVESGNSNFAVSAYLPINDLLRIDSIYSGFSPTYSIVYYNANREFVGFQGAPSRAAQLIKLEIPLNAVYLRFNNRKDDLETANVYANYRLNAELYNDRINEEETAKTQIESVSMARGAFVTKNGAIGRNDVFALSDLIDSEGVTKVYSRLSGDYCVVYYDSNKQYIGYQNSGINITPATGWYNLEQPNGAKYLRFSTNINYCPVSDCKIERKVTSTYLCKQIEKLSYRGADIAMFTDIATCGDSYTRCDLYINGTGVQSYQSSWGKVIERMKGINVSVYAKGGATVKTYLTDPLCLPKLLNESPKQLYILCLGINDYITTLGTIDDITDDYTQNPDTFFGNYGRIIDQIQAHAPAAKIIICRTFSVSTISYEHTAVAISEIALHYALPLLDPAESIYLTSEAYRLNRVSNHPNAAGQSGIAGAMCELIGKVIDKNPEYFGDFYIPE